MKNDTATILFAHGARDPEWARPVEALRARILANSKTAEVRTAFLEFMTPTLDAAIDALVADGARVITIVPVFLAQGGHVKRELPEMMERARERHPDVELALAGVIGEQVEVIEAMARAVLQMTAPR